MTRGTCPVQPDDAGASPNPGIMASIGGSAAPGPGEPGRSPGSAPSAAGPAEAVPPGGDGPVDREPLDDVVDSPIHYQYLVDPAGVGGFQEVPVDRLDPNRVTVNVSGAPGTGDPSFTVLERPGDPEAAQFTVDTSRIGPEPGTMLDGLSTPPSALHDGFRVRTPEGDALTFGMDLPTATLFRHDPGSAGVVTYHEDLGAIDVVTPPRPGEARLNCRDSSGTTFCFDDAGNLAVSRIIDSRNGFPVMSHEYRVSREPYDIADTMAKQSVTWMVEPGDDGENGSLVAFPGIGDAIDPATAALQMKRTRDGTVLSGTMLMGSTGVSRLVSLDPDAGDPPSWTNRAHRSIALDPGSGGLSGNVRSAYSSIPHLVPLDYRLSHGIPWQEGSSRGPNYDLNRGVDPNTGEPMITADSILHRWPVTGELRGDVARVLGQLTGIPAPTNPVNLRVTSEGPDMGVTLSDSTTHGDVRVLGDGAPSWKRDEGTYKVSPSEYEVPAVPGAVATGTGAYKLEPDGRWLPVPLSAVPPLIGTWGSNPGQGGGGGWNVGDPGPSGPGEGPGGRELALVEGGGGSTGAESLHVDPADGARPDVPVLGTTRDFVPRTEVPAGDVGLPDHDPAASTPAPRPTTGRGDIARGVEATDQPRVLDPPPDVPANGGGAIYRPDPPDPAEQERLRQMDPPQPPIPADPPPTALTFPTDAPDVPEESMPDGDEQFDPVPFPFLDGDGDSARRDGESLRDWNLRTGRIIASGTSSSPASESAAVVPQLRRPGSIRTGSDGRRQTYVDGQDLVGDGRAGTTPGRVDHYRTDDGVVEAVVWSPHRDDDGVRTTWTPDLGVSVASNPGADHVTSIQRVSSAAVPKSITSQVVRLRPGRTPSGSPGVGWGRLPVRSATCRCRRIHGCRTWSCSPA